MKTKLSLIALLAGGLFAGSAMADVKIYQCGAKITEESMDGVVVNTEIISTKENPYYKGNKVALSESGDSAKFAIYSEGYGKIYESPELKPETVAGIPMKIGVLRDRLTGYRSGYGVMEDPNYKGQPAFTIINEKRDTKTTYANCIKVK